MFTRFSRFFPPFLHAGDDGGIDNKNLASWRSFAQHQQEEKKRRKYTSETNSLKKNILSVDMYTTNTIMHP